MLPCHGQRICFQNVERIEEFYCALKTILNTQLLCIVELHVGEKIQQINESSPKTQTCQN